MRQPDDFDAFYKDARERLLAQTYALTGDLGASRRAVREAFVVAWHRWRKLSRHEHPEEVVRPHAWRLAQRKHTARVWHREKGISPEVRATLDALGRLSVAQRRALVLTQLASVSMPQMAREVGLPLERAERELQSGAAALALALDVETVMIRSVFERLAASVEGRGRWPRATIVRRSGAARRRTHTVVGALVAVAAVVVSGSLVTDATGVRPSLDDAGSTVPLAAPGPARASSAPIEVTLPDTSLLGAADLQRRYDARTWSLVRTGDNSTGNGMAVPCQRERYADPQGEASLVRYLEGGGKGPAVTATQLTEASATPRAAGRAFRTTAAWVAGCDETQVQLLGTRTPEAVGDEAVQFVLRRWRAPVTTYVVGVARTGSYTTTTAVRLPGAATPDREAAAALLADGVSRLCALPDGGACAPAQPEVTDRDPLPTGKRPALLSEVDLPPVTGVRKPWVGTQPTRPTTNAAATGCDETSFSGRFQGTPFSRSATRTFVVPEGDLPQEFGLTETAAVLPARRAEALVAQVRDKLGSCPQRELNIEVDELARRDEGASSLSAWRLDIKVTDKRAVVFYMAFLRNGTGVAQLGFVPTRGADLPTGAFVSLAERAQARLGELDRTPSRPPS
jgi:DNA-directed RNA polymerase specialized sigma24 family protein